MYLIDTHSHLDDPRLDQVRQQTLDQACQAGVVIQIIPAVSASSWRRVKALCKKTPNLYPCYGLHPLFMDEHLMSHLTELRTWLKKEKAFAVGECGLDYFINSPDKKKQKLIFSEQINIAIEFGLPAVIHANRAVEDVILEIKKNQLRRGVIHSFNGSHQQAERLIDLGFKLSFGGAISYDRATKIRKLIRDLPLDSLMLETDAPDQPPAKYRGELNKPAYLQEVFSVFCQLREEPAEYLAKKLNQNAIELFKLEDTDVLL